MNIKSLANNLSSIESIGHTKIREVKSEQGSADRDADGRRHQQGRAEERKFQPRGTLRASRENQKKLLDLKKVICV